MKQSSSITERTVRFAARDTIDHAKAYFSQLTVESSTPLVDIVPAEPNERWEVIAECDASRAAKGSVRLLVLPSVRPPRACTWTPDGSELIIACDARGIMRWRVPGNTPERHYGDEAFSAHPERIFVSPKGEYVLVATRESMYTVDLRYGRFGIVRWMLTYPFGDHAKSESFSPWRPGTKEILVWDYESLRFTDLSSASGIEKHWSEFPAQRLNLRSIVLSGYEKLLPYAWHPRGHFVAVSIGGATSTVHVLEVQSAEIVATLSSEGSSLAWSPGGTSLLIKTSTASDPNTPGLGVWDSHVWQVRPLTKEECQQRWVQRAADEFAGSYSGKAWSADGQRVIQTIEGSDRRSILSRAGYPCTSLPAAAFAAWSPTDPRCFATFGGEGSERMARIWRLVQAK